MNKWRMNETIFWSRVKRGNGCWVYSGNTTRDGYGRLRFHGKKILAHRLAYMFSFGNIPRNKLILHSCDNPPCVNPKHLFVGTQSDNMADMRQKGRRLGAYNGEINKNSKLTGDIVSTIRRLFGDGLMNQPQLANRYNVSQPAISAVILRKTWKHII